MAVALVVVGLANRRLNERIYAVGNTQHTEQLL
jgi:hypothetical protein